MSERSMRAWRTHRYGPPLEALHARQLRGQAKAGRPRAGNHDACFDLPRRLDQRKRAADLASVPFEVHALRFHDPLGQRRDARHLAQIARVDLSRVRLLRRG